MTGLRDASAAARAATLGVSEVNAHLDDRFNLLTSGRRTALPRHRTLRTTLDWSYETLSPREQELLRALSIFRGPFTLDGASAVAGASAPRSTGVIEVVHGLVAKSLVASDLGVEDLAGAHPERGGHLRSGAARAMSELRAAIDGVPAAAGPVTGSPVVGGPVVGGPVVGGTA